MSVFKALKGLTGWASEVDDGSNSVLSGQGEGVQLDLFRHLVVGVSKLDWLEALDTGVLTLEKRVLDSTVGSALGKREGAEVWVPD